MNYHNDTVSKGNRFEQSVCGHEQNRFVCRVEYAHNTQHSQYNEPQKKKGHRLRMLSVICISGEKTTAR